MKDRRLGPVLGLLSGIGAAAATSMAVYGMLVESKRLVLERRTLPLPYWPEKLSGYKVCLLADFHLRDQYSQEVAQRSIAMALQAEPDMIVLGGDLVAGWHAFSPKMLGNVLAPLRACPGKVVAIAGNHEYKHGTPELLIPIMKELKIKLLWNSSWHHDGIHWVGLDSAKRGRPAMQQAFAKTLRGKDPKIVLWHEPDVVDQLPAGCSLMMSGHSHGGQFRFPFGITPMHSELGRIYPRGFYPGASTPLYVTRGVGTTGPPIRFNCPPEVSLLRLVPLGVEVDGGF